MCLFGGITTTTNIKFQQIFITLRKALHPLSSHPLFSPPPSCWHWPMCGLFLWIFLLRMFYVNGIIQYASFCVWLLSLSIRSCDFKWEAKVKTGVVGKVGSTWARTWKSGYFGENTSKLKELPLPKDPWEPGASQWVQGLQETLCAWDRMSGRCPGQRDLLGPPSVGRKAKGDWCLEN